MNKQGSKHHNGYWTKALCLASAKKFKTKSEWAKSSGSAYQSARKNGWLEQCAVHMKPMQKPSGWWTQERCKEEAQKFHTRKEWATNSSSSYLAASRNGWLPFCCAHMSIWTLEKCRTIALQFTTKAAFKKYESRAYRMAEKNGWLDQCCIHMKK